MAAVTGITSPSTVTSTAASNAAAPSSSSPPDPEKVAREATARELADAVVVKVGNQMNLGDTGFDRGVSEKVYQAISSALSQKTAKSDSGSSTLLPIGGQYQNAIMYGSKTPPTPSKPPVSTQPPVEAAPSEPTPSIPEAGIPESGQPPSTPPSVGEPGRNGRGRRSRGGRGGRGRNR